MKIPPPSSAVLAEIPHGTTASGNPAHGAAAVARTAEIPTAAGLQRVADDINQYLQPVNRSLRFSIDPETGTTIATLYDKGSQKVIRQIPSEEQLAIMHAIDRLRGLMLRAEA
jgi:flagellar protein FlaG